MLHLLDALKLRCDRIATRPFAGTDCCIYSMHFNFVATKTYISGLYSTEVASTRCTATTLLPRAGQGKDQMLVLHLCDALQLRCYSGIFLRNGKSSVASIRCTSTTLLLSTTVLPSLSTSSCIYPMHCNYVATIVLSWIIFWPTSCIYAMHFDCHSAFLAPQNHYSAKKAKTLWQGGRKCPPLPRSSLFASKIVCAAFVTFQRLRVFFFVFKFRRLGVFFRFISISQRQLCQLWIAGKT